MSSLDTRIQQFKQMAEADPTNELGHFSLGKAYLEAERFSEAVTSLRKAVELNAKLSKAYQFLGDALYRAGQRDQAIEAVTKGVTTADQQGDRMPRDAMVSMLKGWDASVPAFENSATEGTPVASSAAATGFQCVRCGRPAGKLEKAPFRGKLGQKIFDHVCNLCWGEWIAMGTKVINELGLVLSSDAGQEAYDQYMIEFLQIEDR